MALPQGDRGRLLLCCMTRSTLGLRRDHMLSPFPFGPELPPAESPSQAGGTKGGPVSEGAGLWPPALPCLWPERRRLQ